MTVFQTMQFKYHGRRKLHEHLLWSRSQEHGAPNLREMQLHYAAKLQGHLSDVYPERDATHMSLTASVVFAAITEPLSKQKLNRRT